MRFSLNAMNRVRRLAPDLEVVMLVDKAHHWPALRPVVGADWVIGPGIDDLREHPGSAATVRAGREIDVWTVNTAEDLDSARPRRLRGDQRPSGPHAGVVGS